MNPPPKDVSLSIDLLNDALLECLRENRQVPYSRMIIHERCWRPVLEGLDALFIRGMVATLVNSDQMDRLLRAAFTSNYSFDYHSVFLFPDATYDQSLAMGLDFGFKTTREVEALLRSGRVSIIPCDGDFQWGYTVTVTKNEGSLALADLIAPDGAHGRWSLRGEISIRVQGRDIKIVGDQGCPSDPGKELSAALAKRYGLPVDTAGLRAQAANHLDLAIRHEKRAAYFERMNK